jgi:hypothetical protein
MGYLPGVPDALKPLSAANRSAAGTGQTVRHRRVGWAAAFLGGLLILALLAAFVFYRLETAPGRAFAAGTAKVEDWAGRVRDAFVAVAHMQPRVTVNEHVVLEQTSPVLELAVLEREATVEQDTTASWLGSTKHIRLRGLYRIKAGFDLHQPFSAHIDGAQAQTVRVDMPPAKLLSVEQVKLEVLDLDNGLWNRVKPDELQDAIAALNDEARLKAADAHLTRQAEIVFLDELREKLGPGHEVLGFTPGNPAGIPALR